MRLGIVFLVIGYVLSQFYRAFLAVLAPVLEQDIGTNAAQLSVASGLWFITFAAMQIPVGIALDSVGPRKTAGYLLAFGAGGGALVFAAAQGPLAVYWAMALIGIGCSPVLMASYYIFARVYSPAVFGTLAGAVIGFGNFGNLAGSVPLAMAAEAFGWRATLSGLAVVTLLVAMALLAFVKDPPKLDKTSGPRGSIFDLLKMPVLWMMFVMMLANYAPAAGLRGLWAGPYFADMFGLDAQGIGRVTLAMGLAMIVGNFSFGVMDRIFGTRKWVVIVGNLLGALCLLALFASPTGSLIRSAMLVAAVGFFGSTFPLIMAHGRSFLPPHLVGRGVTLLNLFGIGGVGLMQIVTGRIHSATLASGGDVQTAYGQIFLTFALLLIGGCAIYLFSPDRVD